MIFKLYSRVKTYLKELMLYRKWQAVPNAKASDVNPNYILTYDLLGIRNKHPKYCPFCGAELIIRNTRLDWSPELSDKNLHIDLRFKCPQCDWWCTFGIPVPKHYFLYVWQLRKKHGVGRIYAPVEEWKSKNEIKEKLEKLGYW